MRQTFFLRKPKETKPTLILFSCSFKNEEKQFIYSVRESIHPENWSFEKNRPKNKGKQVAIDQRRINNILNQYEDEFYTFQARCEMSKVKFTSALLKNHLDEVFGHVAKKKTTFFEVYDLFMDEKIKRKEWKKSTVNRYINIRNLLVDFQRVKKHKLTFSKINNTFYTEFIDYCYDHKNHYSNTFNRNMGLFKTFMFWSLKKEYTYNNKFVEFKRPPRVLTRQEALNLEEVKRVYEYPFENETLNEVKDCFIFQCLTGMRFGELKFINRRIINSNNCIVLKEEKDSSKSAREIPLMSISKSILEKYNFKLPLIAEQNHNNYIKEIMKNTGFNHEVEFTRTQGVEQTLFIKKFYERISTHTARRTFVTIMRNKGVPDKIIMSITGHKDIKTFNAYHQVNDDAKISAVKSVFDNF